MARHLEAGLGGGGGGEDGEHLHQRLPESGGKRGSLSVEVGHAYVDRLVGLVVG
jgi:hypothetical protein